MMATRSKPWEVLLTPERSHSIMFRRTQDLAESAQPCSPRSNTARGSEATRVARLRAPKRRGVSTSNEDIPRTDPLTANSAQHRAARCQGALAVQESRIASVRRCPKAAHDEQPHLRHRRAFAISLSEIPFARAQDSTAVSPYWATTFLTTQQGTACAGNKTSNAATTTVARIICRA